VGDAAVNTRNIAAWGADASIDELPGYLTVSWFSFCNMWRRHHPFPLDATYFSWGFCMRLRVIMTLLLVAIAAACSDSDSPTSPEGVTLEVQFDHDKHHLVPLNGAEEVPTRNTQATARAIFHISNDGQKMAYELMVSNITNVVQAHIHLAQAGSNGSIVLWLYPSTAAGPANPPGGGRLDGMIVKGEITSADLRDSLAGQPLQALIDQINAGNAYVNIHTSDGVAPADTGPGDFPGGEIRGQIR
jgi:CHRD domain